MRLASAKEQVSGPIQISLIHRAIQAVLRTHLSFLTHLRTPEERSQPGENHYTNTYLPSRDSRAGGIGWLTKMRLLRQGAVLVRKHNQPLLRPMQGEPGRIERGNDDEYQSIEICTISLDL